MLFRVEAILSGSVCALACTAPAHAIDPADTGNENEAAKSEIKHWDIGSGRSFVSLSTIGRYRWSRQD